MTTTQQFSVSPLLNGRFNSRRNRQSKIPESLCQRLRRPRSMLLISVAQHRTFAQRRRLQSKFLRCDDALQKVPRIVITSPRTLKQKLLLMSSTRRSSTGAGAQQPPSRTQDPAPQEQTATAPSGRERLAIGFLAGTQPVQHSSSSGSSSHGHDQLNRQRTSSGTPNPGRRFTHHTPSAYNASGGLTRGDAIPASPPDVRGRTYHLEVVQHPERSAEFGSAVLSRLPLSPPPIVQLTIRDHAGAPVNPNSELPFLVAHLHLHAEDGTPLDMENTGQNILYGSTVSSAQTLRNLQGSMGSFFVFPDVSISVRGRYILRITLMRLPRIGLPTPANASNSAGTLATAYTRPFDIVSQTNYAAPQPTQLTQYFIRQGARMANNGL